MKNKSLLVLGFILSSGYLQAQRSNVLLNKNWHFRFSHEVERNSGMRVDLPHTWNPQDALVGKIDYKRGIGNYTRTLEIPSEWKGKRLFLKFEGANSVTHVFINGKHIGEHRGGYSAFVFEITEQVKYGTKNTLLVRVNNGEQLDVMPLVGDFNFYGGIYRDVSLITTSEVCIAPHDHASPGVFLVQRAVSEKKADVTARIDLSNNKSVNAQVKLQLTVSDGKKTVLQQEKEISIAAHTSIVQDSICFTINNPRLWNGTVDPFLYQATVSLLQNGKVIDSIQQPLGLRYFHIDPSKGLILNGKHLRLQGVCRHQERAETGNALLPAHHEEDVNIMLEMGANAVRLAHYPQAEYLLNLLDKKGIVAWSEIPFIGPGGYADKGFVDSPSFRENGKLQLRELIRQNYNHPSIICWGLFNELKEEGDNPIAYIRELNALAHIEDTTRPTTAASNQSSEMNYITNLIAWNRYDGWYGSTPTTLATFLDNMHAKRPELCIGVSEYGAGASIRHQQDTLIQTTPTSRWHPENWQTYYHMENWKIIQARPFVWGSFIWNLFDFGAAHRTEGDRSGINDKGLVTHDRKIRKDAFYFYKANWNKKEPMIYLAEKRIIQRSRSKQTFMAFTTAPRAELFINGRSMGIQQTDSVATVIWKNIELKSGSNEIKVITADKSKMSDEIVVVLNP